MKTKFFLCCALTIIFIHFENSALSFENLSINSRTDITDDLPDINSDKPKEELDLLKIKKEKPLITTIGLQLLAGEVLGIGTMIITTWTLTNPMYNDNFVLYHYNNLSLVDAGALLLGSGAAVYVFGVTDKQISSLNAIMGGGLLGLISFITIASNYDFDKDESEFSKTTKALVLFSLPTIGAIIGFHSAKRARKESDFLFGKAVINYQNKNIILGFPAILTLKENINYKKTVSTNYVNMLDIEF